MRFLRYYLVWLLLGGLLASSLLAADQSLWKAGTARAVITPKEPLWMAGYASRTNPADGKVMELWIKVRTNWRKDPRSLKEFGYLS